MKYIVTFLAGVIITSAISIYIILRMESTATLITESDNIFQSAITQNAVLSAISTTRYAQNNQITEILKYNCSQLQMLSNSINLSGYNDPAEKEIVLQMKIEAIELQTELEKAGHCQI